LEAIYDVFGYAFDVSAAVDFDNYSARKERVMLNKLGVLGLIGAIAAQIAAIVALAVYAPATVSVPLIVALILF
jgi:hypothetical protein